MRCFRTPDNDPLYVILPYFNYCGFKKRYRLFCEFVIRNSHLPGVKLVVVEARGKSSLPQLPAWKHIKVDVNSTIWIKENLINVGASKLPDDWKYLAWVDADIHFLNENWVSETKESLEFYDVVQLFQSAINLGPRGETIKVDKSFGYMYSQSSTQYKTNDKYGFWHPGYAWACTRAAWNKMGGLIDWAILGSADRHMALAWIQKADLSRPGNIHQNYKNLVSDFEKECKGFRIGNINGSIIHEWHGSLENRKYKERWQVLTQHNFDPLNDVGIDEKGILQLTRTGKRLEDDIKSYFYERKEDS